jgi:hypothetical protein
MKKKKKKSAQYFSASGECSYITYDDYIIDHDYLDDGYITFGYLDNDIMTISTTTHRNNSSRQRLRRHLRL